MRFKLSLLFLFLISLINAQSEVNYSPKTVLYNHLSNLQIENYKPEQAAESFPITDPSKAKKAAKQLKQILDGNGIYISMEDVPESPNYKDSIENKSVYYIDNSYRNLYLEKVNGKWFYSRETVNAIPQLYKKLYPLGFHLDAYFTNPFWKTRFLTIQTWQWFSLLVLIVISVVLYFIFSVSVKKVSQILFSKWLGKEFFKEVNFQKGVKVFSWYIAFKIAILLLPSIQLPVQLNLVFIRGLEILSIFLLVFVLIRLVSAIFSLLEKAAEKTENTMDDQLLPVIRKIVKVLIWVVGAIFILAQLKINITALLAGLSIGGLAMALAAQDTVKNFFGSVMIFLDRPFQIGDWIHFDEVDGVVEEVGIRSTRIRTFANSLVYVPNAHLANVTVDNMGLRQFRRYKTEIGITYDTPPEIIDLFVEGIKEIISSRNYLTSLAPSPVTSAVTHDAIRVEFFRRRRLPFILL